MATYTQPTIKDSSFNCPHCHAKAHQDWYDSYVNKLKSIPPIYTKKLYAEQIAAMPNPHGEENYLLEILLKSSNGELVLIDSYGTTINYKLENLSISECYSCEKISLWVHDKMVWPARSEAEIANPDMPDDIKKDYEEARSIVNLSPRAAAALLRLCVEKLCKDVPKNTLDNKIGYLVEQGLSVSVQKALDAVRVIGNESVHPGEIDLNDDNDTAYALFKIVNIIVSKLISEEKQIDEIFSKIPDSKKEGIHKRDKKEEVVE